MASFKIFVVLLVFYSTSTISNCQPIDDGMAEELKEEIQNLSKKVDKIEERLINHICGCHKVGSTSLDCTEDGQCSCKPGYSGLKCNSCDEGYYGFPNCQEEEMTALIVGGYGEEGVLNTTEIFPQGRTCSSNSLPSLPTGISGQPSLVQTSEEEILLCGGINNEQKCLELKDNQWQEEHSNLKNSRRYASAVSMPVGILLFGGEDSRTTWEWLPSGTNQWQSGTTSIPSKFGFDGGCAVKINDTEILLIGGYETYKRVLKFNTNTNKFTNLGDVLNQGRYWHACTLYDNQVIITGGKDSSHNILKSTETINLNDLTKAHTTGNLVQKRTDHGLIVVHVDNKPTVLAVGGRYYENGYKRLDSIEKWNPTTETWTMTEMKLSEPKDSFGILSLPTRLLCP